MSRLDDVQAALKAATPGPWTWETSDGFGMPPVPLIRTVDTRPETTQAIAETGYDAPEQNAALIVAAVNAVPGLLAIARAAERIGVGRARRLAELDLRHALAEFEAGRDG